MQTPLYVRPLTADERAILETGLRSSSAFTVRRCQSLLASAEGQSTTTIAHQLRCTDQTVRNTIHAFHQRGLAMLQPLSSRPHTPSTIFDVGTCESLRALLHQSPRTFGKPTSRWTLSLAAEEGPDTQRNRMESAARAAVTAMGHLFGVNMLALEGVQHAEMFGRNVAVVGVLAAGQRDSRLLMGTAEVRESMDHAAV